MIYIRTDANRMTGTGHVMRCLSIADALKDRGETVKFIISDEQSTPLIEKRGFPVSVLHTEWNRMEQELPMLEQLIKRDKAEKLLADSYQVTENYLNQLSRKIKTVYMDDTSQFHCPANMLVCYSNCWHKYNFEKKYPDTKLLLGPEYTPLRREFSDCPPKKIKYRAEELLLVSGGTDRGHSVKRILAKLSGSEYEKITVVCGIFNEDCNSLQEQYQDYENIDIHSAVPDLKPYMDQADFVISAGGTTLCELCASGTPAVSFSLAENQTESVKQYDEDGIIEYAGDIREEDLEEKVMQTAEKYRDDFYLRQERSRKMQEFIDGRGAGRIAEELLKL